MSTEPDARLGRTLGGRFHLLSVLGHGGTGTVYEAEQAGISIGPGDMMGNAGPGMLAGLRVIEIADERGEYTGLLLAGLLTTGGRAGMLQALAQLPVAGVTSGGALSALPMITIVVFQAAKFPWQGVLAAAVASEFLGMILARWAVARAGEFSSVDEATAG